MEMNQQIILTHIEIIIFRLIILSTRIIIMQLTEISPLGEHKKQVEFSF